MDGRDTLVGYGNAQYDQHAKRILADKKIMAYILKRTVPEFQDATLEDIAEKYIEGEPQIGTVPVNPDKTHATRGGKVKGDRNESTSPTEGWVTFDILFHAKAPGSGDLLTLIINVEAQKTQNKNRLGYDILKRAVYYAGRLISSQKETEFAGSDYDGVKKVYSIFICMDSPNGKNAINRYEMTERHLLHRCKAQRTSYDLISIVMIFLGNERTQDRAISLLQLLFTKTKLSGQQKEEQLERDYHIQLTSDLREEMSTMCNLSEGLVDRVTEEVTREVTKKVTRKVTREVTKKVKAEVTREITKKVTEDVTMKSHMETARNIMDVTGWSIDQVLDTMKIPEAMRLPIRKALAH